MITKFLIKYINYDRIRKLFTFTPHSLKTAKPMSIYSVLALISITGILFTLSLLTIIDLKTRLLPNIWVGFFALFALAFHFSTQGTFITWQDALIGAFLGGGLLLLVRTIGNFYYKQDTLGLGDVKLMTAGGLWLGYEHITLAIVCGALAGVCHGLLLIIMQWRRTKKLEPLSTFSLPAGPGFIVGILIAALVKFQGLPHYLFS